MKNIPSKHYNCIGTTYNRTRQPDERIFSQLKTLLKCQKNDSIVDIGAGTGNYSMLFAEEGCRVDALEPSEVMQQLGKKHKNLQWITAAAEDIPTKARTYDGAICTLATHHFTSQEQAFGEIYRVLKKNKNFIIFTADPRRAEKTWIDVYFKDLVKKAEKTLPDLDEVIKLLKNTFLSEPEVISFPLPFDLKDAFFYSAWRYPNKYLNRTFRQGISSFALADEDEVNKMISQLKSDLDNNTWEEHYGPILNKNELDCGYYFIKIKKEV